MKYSFGAILLLLSLIPASNAAESPWNGLWSLDSARSSPGTKDEAAPAYRFTLQPDGGIKWEIPALKEVVTGKVDGQPMIIHSPTAPAGLTLSVRADGPRVLTYKVSLNRKLVGEGRMMLVDNGRAWVDVTWSTASPENARELVYVRQP